MPVFAFSHTEDPKGKIFRKVGNLDNVDVFNSQVLVGVYQRPEEAKTKSGLLVTHLTTGEDRFQSKVGVILKMGPSAFRDERGVWFKDQEMQVGDWVVYRASDGWSLGLPVDVPETGDERTKGFLCKLMDDTAIRMRIPHPDAIY